MYFKPRSHGADTVRVDTVPIQRLGIEFRYGFRLLRLPFRFQTLTYFWI